MQFSQVYIESMAHFISSQVLTSKEIENQLTPLYQRFNLPVGRLEMMSGIKERRIWPSGTLPSYLSTMAAKEAFAKSHIDKKDIDLLIHSSVCRDFLEPSTASAIHHNLELRNNCLFFDLSNACVGFLNSILVASSMIQQGNIRNALIVTGENATPLIEQTINKLNTCKDLTRKSIKQYFANLTVGSAAAAYIITGNKSLNEEMPEILGGSSLAKTESNHLCKGNGDIDSLTMATNSSQLLIDGLELSAKTWEETKKTLSWTNDTPSWAISHQVSKTHEFQVLERLKLQHLKTFSNFETLGNTGSAALPTALSQLSQTKKVQPGEYVALLGIGSGLSSTMLGIKW